MAERQHPPERHGGEGAPDENRFGIPPQTLAIFRVR